MVCFTTALLLGLAVSTFVNADVIVGSPDANTRDGARDGANNACNDAANGPHSCSEPSDDFFMMQSRTRVSHISDLEALVQNAVQEAIGAQNDEIANLKKAFSKRDEELNVLNEKLKQQETKHEQFRQEHRLTYGLLIQVCQKGLQRYAQSSENGANMTDVAPRGKKWGPLGAAVDWTKDRANDVADVAVDTANAAADVATDAANTVATTVSDLADDVGSWTIDALAALQSLVGLSWRDIPGLSSIVDELRGAVNGVKDFAVDAANVAVDAVKDWVSILEKELKSITDYVADLYNKYLKPIIIMVWDCAKNAKSPLDFVVCIIKPVLEKLMEALVPTESVSDVVPFPFDEDALRIDPETNLYTLKQSCHDCQAGDFRDLAPLQCEKKELNFLSIFKMTAHACNVPLMPGQCKGNLATCLKKRASKCAKSAILWAPSGVLSKLSAPLEQAMEIGQTIVQKVAGMESAVRALHVKAKELQSSSETAIKDILLQFDDAASNAQATKESVVRCLKAVSQLSAAGSWNNMIPHVEEVIASVERLIGNIENTQASVETLETSLTDSSSSTLTEAQELFTQCRSDVQTLKSDIETLKVSLLNLYEDSKSVSEELLGDFQAALAAPVDQLEDLGSFMAKCATARESYQKVYVDLEVVTVTAGRLVLHERDGVKLAYINPGQPNVHYESWPWSSFDSKQGQTIELCVFVYCIKFNVKLRKNPNSILGVPVNVGGSLDSLKWFELEYKELSYDLNVIGVPYKFSDPTGVRLPTITLPFLVDTPAPAANPTSNPDDVLNTLWQQVVNNKAEAASLGTATAPSLPADAASGTVINSIKSDVDTGFNKDSPSFAGGPSLAWSEADLVPGSWVALWSPRVKRFISMTGTQMIRSDVRNDGTLPDDWVEQRFKVVDAGNGRIAFWNPKWMRFMALGSAGTNFGVSSQVSSGEYPAGWSSEAFEVLQAGDSYVGFWNPHWKTLIKMGDSETLLASPAVNEAKYPASWQSEKFTVVAAPPGIVGATVAVWSPLRQRFFKITANDVMTSPAANQATFPNGWPSEHFKVVDAGGGYVGFWSPHQKRFIKMASTGPLKPSAQVEDGKYPAGWGAEKFKIVDAGNGYVGIWSPTWKSFIGMPAYGSLVMSTKVEDGKYPAGWASEKFKVSFKS